MAARACPACGSFSVKVHCESTAAKKLLQRPPMHPSCTWLRCTREACLAVFDPRGRGYQVLPGDVVRPFAFDE